MKKYIFLTLCLLSFSIYANATEFYFVRHGESEANIRPEQICGESQWAELTEEGKNQAKTLGRHLQSITFDVLYTSDIVRTQQTARYFLEAQENMHKKTIRQAQITEKSLGDWEGRMKTEIIPAEPFSWDFIPGDTIKGESDHQVAIRMVEWIQEKSIAHPNERVLVFCHGNALRFLLAELFDLERNSIRSTMPIDNTSVTIIRYEDGKYFCPVLNDTSHLQEKKDSDTKLSLHQ